MSLPAMTVKELHDNFTAFLKKNGCDFYVSMTVIHIIWRNREEVIRLLGGKV